MPSAEILRPAGHTPIGNSIIRVTFSQGKQSSILPLLISESGYGILIASQDPTLFCDIPTYDSFLYTEGAVQMDCYFIADSKPHTLLSAYAYLCGRL